MDILYLLIPMSALLVLGILAVFAWALQDGQFDDVDVQGQAFQDTTPLWLDAHQAR
jgi:cbb3-type cytochrome oxidase maturation protein